MRTNPEKHFASHPILKSNFPAIAPKIRGSANPALVAAPVRGSPAGSRGGMHLRRKLGLLAWLVVACLGGWTANPAVAVPACPEPVEVTQPDGAKMRVNLRGDEFFSWHETAAGYAIVKDPTDKFWKFARPASKRAEFQALSGARVGTSDPASLGLKKHAMPDAKALRTFLEDRHRTVRGVATARATPSATPEDPPTAPGVIPPLGIPVSGTKTIKNIVILACFSDHCWSVPGMETVVPQATTTDNAWVTELTSFFTMSLVC